MKTLKVMILVVSLSGCGQESTRLVNPPVTTKQVTAAPAATPVPIVAPTPTPEPVVEPTPTPSPTPCATFNNTRWVSTSPNAIVSEFNNIDGVFTENYEGFQCNRRLSDGVPFGDPLSLVWPEPPVGHPCNGVPPWIGFDTMGCSELSVVFRDGQGRVIQTETYAPTNSPAG